MCRPGCLSCGYGVFRCSVSPRVIIVFKGINYIIIILYICDIWLSVSTFGRIVIPRSEKEGTKPPYVCPGCSNHTYSNNMITRFHVQ
jgi:hypothetical protein